MPKFINWGIISHPVNWITVALMVVIGTMALNLLLTPWHVTAIPSNGLSPNSQPGPDLNTMQ